ncbi:exodeoxyribonuclease VII small subunit [Demequina sp. SYSU T00039]|uniref:Exodeoxyribonuclease 7 small subunit n=1 Tax=Demequina lignilytica TaxID=3051663 RepID=A0AAW7M8R5_9MICO|nr:MULTISPECIES: exodeoxyribonuclease VII small subunit [unclassified Demequina]MDN4477634.1 exodeoxyribonuclease VII small subunit [Demequina sp. SYSU T00039-1]MDN4488015.1 exodeoxyribonuclease VII small subunit [Demequina sp. SYSU T00039]
MTDATSPLETPVDDLSYEEARDQLVGIVARLEAGSATLEESLGLWERGEALAARCQTLLDGARDRIAAARGVDEDDADAGIVGVAATDDED